MKERLRKIDILEPTLKTLDNIIPLGALIDPTYKEEKGSSTLLILDCLTDIGNIGAIIRSAVLLGVDCVILPNHNTISAGALKSGAILKSSAGSVVSMKFCIVPNLSESIKLLQKSGYWVYGADMEGQKISETKFAAKTAIVMGSEGNGISKLVKKTCDQMISIPMLPNEFTDSLNVSVSTGIILYERSRQLAGIKK